MQYNVTIDKSVSPDTTVKNTIYTVVHKKTCHFYFFNSSVQHWSILIIFVVQHQKNSTQITILLATSF